MIDDPVHILDADIPQNLESESNQLFITEEICDYWRKSSRWAAALATVGYISMAMIVVWLCWTLAVFFNTGADWVPLVCGVPILVWVYFLSSRMYQYSVKVKHAADYSDWDDLETAFSRLKSSYILYGAFVLLFFALLAVLISLLVGKSIMSNL